MDGCYSPSRESERHPKLQAEVKYVLVMPYTKQGCDVFIQFVDISMLGIGIRDIFGEYVTT